MVIAFLLAAILQLQAATQPKVKNPTISVTITAISDVVKLGSEVRIKVTVTNKSDRDKWLGTSSGKSQGEVLNLVDVRDEQGNAPTRTKYHRVLRGENAGDHPQEVMKRDVVGSLTKPGESVTEEIILNKLYDLNKSGKYEIQVEHEDPETKALVKSNTITVTVTP